MIPDPTTSELDLEYFLPEYGDKGRVLFVFIPGLPVSWQRDNIIEVFDYDQNSSLYWMEEGVGIQYGLDEILDIELEGYYVAEGVYGEYYRGNWAWGEDDDEEWHIGSVRRATEREIETLLLDPVSNVAIR